ncbi:putative ribonuclease H-like domain-containing protein [Tanacetum coccineum]|uniref:Ribonuclease H-like domain-containing protein n=1 Tax=Tanacetum coccineum TaxID=301880 RepID=A0ABQ4ZDL2_9ASTR
MTDMEQRASTIGSLDLMEALDGLKPFLRCIVSYAMQEELLAYSRFKKFRFLVDLPLEEGNWDKMCVYKKNKDVKSVVTANTPIETQKPLIKDKEAADVDVHLYRSMIGSLSTMTATPPMIISLHTVLVLFLGNPQQVRMSISWQETYSGLQEANNYGYFYYRGRIYIDNESTICIVKNPVFHSKTKHIEIRHHFIKDAYEKKLIKVLKIHTDDNVADLSTKAFNASSQIKATISGQTVLILESSIRRDLLFNDDNGIDCLTVADIYETLPLMGYEGDLTTLTFQKSLFSPQWKYLIHTIIHCLSSKSTSWDQFPTNVASAVICLATNRTFNFSKMIFGGMNRILEAKKKFLIYPRRGLHFSGHVTPLFPTMLVPAAVEEGKGLGTHTEPQPTPSPTQPSIGDQTYITESSSRPENTQNSKNTLEGTKGSEGDHVQLPHDSPLLGGHTSNRAEGGLNREELFVLCTNLSNRILALETSKDAQATKILKLKTRIKKLEKKCKPIISHHKAWLRSVSILSMKKKMGKKESISKQGRKDAKPGPTLDDSAFDDLNGDLAHGMDYMEIEEAVNEGRTSSKTEELNATNDTEQLNITNDTVIIEEKDSGEKGRSTEDPVSTAVPKDSNAPHTPITVIKDKDIFLVDARVMLSDKTQLKGVEIKEIKDTDRPARLVLTLKPLPTIDPKDKGKGILEEEPKPVNVKSKGQEEAQMAMDEKVARQLDEQLQAELERERVVKEEATNAALIREYDEIQARVNADSIVAARLQEEEREKFTFEERAKFLHDIIAAQRKFLAEQRAAAIRNKPPTKSQLRSQMMTYLRHVGSYKHAQLNIKNFEEIQVLYERQKKSIQDFVPIGSAEDERLIEKMSKKAAGEDTSKKEKVLEEHDSTKMEDKKEEVEESTKKRPGTILKMTRRKKAMKQTHADGDASKKRKGSPRMKRISKRKNTDSDLEKEEHLKNFLKIVPNEEGIVNYEVLEKRYPIINWESKFYYYDRHGAEAIYYKIFRSDGRSRWIKTFSKMMTMFDRLDLMETMFDTNAEDELWKNQERYGTKFHMLAKRKYPLTKETLEKMMSLKLVVESASDSAYNLLRFIHKKIDESGSYDGKQMAFGKDFSNPLMVDSLPKTIWFSAHHASHDKMESVNAQVVPAAKIPVLNINEFDLWKMRIEQYFLMTDYSLWEVILNGDSPSPTRTVEGVDQFNIHKDAKSLMEAIEKRFGGNKETKKVQKTLLKQHYENFNGSSSEEIDQIHDRIQNISQLKIHGESITQEDVNSKFLRSLPSEWKSQTLIWRNKTDLEDLSLDDLFNNLKIYEAEVKGSSSSSRNTQNVAFVSFNSSGSTNETVNTAHDVSAASTQDYAFTLPNVNNLKQIDPDDLEAMDLQWQMAMLTMRARRFFKKTGRNLSLNGADTIGFDKTKCDGLGYDWSDQAEELPTSFALMTYTSSRSSNSLGSYTKLNVTAYKSGLESVEARLEVYKKNEAIFEEDIKILKIDVMLRDKVLAEHRKKFEKAKKERDDLKLTLEKFQYSLKNLSKLLDSQVSDNHKSGVRYDSQVSDENQSDVENISQMNDKNKTCEWYHAVPPPYTGNYLPPKLELVLADTNEFVFSEPATSMPANKVKTSKSKLVSVRRECSAPIIEDWEFDSDDEDDSDPKSVIKPIKQEDVSKTVKPNYAKIKFVRPKPARKPVEQIRQDTNSPSKKKMVQKPVWNNAMRVNHQNLARMTHPHPKRNFVPTSVLTRSGKVPINIAKQNFSKAAVSVNTARPVNTAFLRPRVNSTSSMSNTFSKAHSLVGRPFNKLIAKKNSNFYNRVNTVKGSGVNTARPRTSVNTARPRATVNAARPRIVVNTARTRSAVNTARPKAVLKAIRGNLVNAHALKDQGVFDSGCSRHMTGNKSYLTDFEEIDGGFVAFGELKFNLLSVSQICDKKNNVLFTDTECVVLSSDFKLLDESQVLLRVPRKHNMYNVDLKNIVPSGGLTCLFARATLDESNLWHRRLGHINFKTMNKLVKGNLVSGLPSKIFENNHTCVACRKGKQHKAFCKTKTVSSICQPLQMFHMDLFGPTFVKSLIKKMYCLVVTDDYSRFSWVFFLATKDETSGILKAFITGIENLIDLRVKVIRCDNGTEFKNRVMNEFCEMKGIKREFCVARTTQQNGVAKRKNRTLIKAARIMLADSKLPTTFWAEAVNTALYVQNRVLVIKPHNKTLYELFLGRKLALGFMRPFGCPITILNTIYHLGKFDGKADEGFFVGYSLNSKAFRVFNSRTRIVEENLHPVVAGNQSNGSAGTKDSKDVGQAGKKTIPNQKYLLLPLWTSNLPFSSSPKSLDDKVADDAGKKVSDDPREATGSNDQVKDANTNSTNSIYTVSTPVNTASTNELPDDPNMPALEEIIYLKDDEEVGAEADMTNLDTNIPVRPILTTKIHKDHPLDQVIGDVQSATQTRRMTEKLDKHALVSRIREGINHKDFQNCLFDYFLSQIEPKKVIQALTDPSWIEAMQEELLKFKLQKVWTLMDLPKGKRAIGTKWVFRNKKDERGIVVRNKARLVVQGRTQEKGIDYDDVFAPVARIEAISAFLYGTIEEEVYVCQPPGFEDPEFPNKVYKVEKALYGLHQAPRAWYETLSTYLIENGFKRGTIDKTLFIKKDKCDILLVHVYVDDIIFGSTKKSLCIEFKDMMHKRFQMSSIDKYVADILKKFDFTTVKKASTPMETNKALLKDAEADDVDVHLYRSMIGSLIEYLELKGQPNLGLWYPKDSPLDLDGYSDSDYAGASLDRKSTTGGCQFLGRRLVSWQRKKQTVVASSTTEAEYVAAASCYGQVLWIQNQLLDYGYNFMNTKIFVDNESTICIVKNPVFHSKTKHIEIRHHFIRDSYEKKLIQVIKIHTDLNVDNLLTKAFDVNDIRENVLEYLTSEALIEGRLIVLICSNDVLFMDWNEVEKLLRRELELKLSSEPTNLVANETVYEEMYDRVERATTTATSLDAEQDNGGRPSCQETMGTDLLKLGKDLLLLLQVNAIRLNLLLLKVNAVRHKLTTAGAS